MNNEGNVCKSSINKYGFYGWCSLNLPHTIFNRICVTKNRKSHSNFLSVLFLLLYRIKTYSAATPNKPFVLGKTVGWLPNQPQKLRTINTNCRKVVQKLQLTGLLLAFMCISEGASQRALRLCRRTDPAAQRQCSSGSDWQRGIAPLW